jgi:hypothetical protein
LILIAKMGLLLKSCGIACLQLSKNIMQIIIEPQVKEKLNALVRTLLQEGYYATEAAAYAYAQAIIDFIFTLPRRTARKTKDKRHGEFYATYKANRHTTWYVTFDVQDDIYLVRNVLNRRLSKVYCKVKIT